MAHEALLRGQACRGMMYLMATVVFFFFFSNPREQDGSFLS